MAGISGASALVVAILAVATNVATTLLPAWKALENPGLLWGIVTFLVGATVLLAVAASRASSENPPDSVDPPPSSEVGHPEDPRFTSITTEVLPGRVSLFRLLDLPASDLGSTIAERWNHSIGEPIKIPIGQTYNDETVVLDIIRDGPSGYVSGTSGSGTTEALTSIALAIACRYPPSRIRLHLFDFKNTAVWGGIRRLPHVASVAAVSDALETPTSFRNYVDEILRSKTDTLVSEGASEAIFDLLMFDQYPIGDDYYPNELVEKLALVGRNLNCGVIVGFQNFRAITRVHSVFRYGLVLGQWAIREHQNMAELPPDKYENLFEDGHHPGRGVLIHSGYTIIPIQVASAGEWQYAESIPWLDRHDMNVAIDAIVALCGGSDDSP